MAQLPGIIRRERKTTVKVCTESCDTFKVLHLAGLALADSKQNKLDD